MHENVVSGVILDAAIEVHRALGPGLLESVYEVALAHVLRRRGLAVACQVAIPIVFDGIRFEEGFRADLIVANLVIVEIKSLERTAPAHRKQVLTYLKLSGIRPGILVNFGEPVVADGFLRLVNGLTPEPRDAATGAGAWFRAERAERAENEQHAAGPLRALRTLREI